MQKVYLRSGTVEAQVIEYVNQQIKIPTGGRIVPIFCGKDENGEKVSKDYIPLYMGFDIETTNVIRGDYKAAYMYIAQCCIATHKGAYLYIFRTWEAVITFFQKLQAYLSLGEKRRVICWIANAGFELQFMRKRLQWQAEKFDFFAKEIRKPLLATAYGIEFREALSITGGSLASLAKDYCTTQKLKGDLDYAKSEITGKPRNNTTPLSAKELQYCYNDVIILSEFSEQIYTRYIRGMKKVPLTKTGLLRAEVKEEFRKLPDWREYKQLITWAFPDKIQYDFWKEYLFRGGYVHANVLYAGQTLDKWLHKNYDITSSYPAQMNLRYFPMSKFMPVEFTTMEEFKQLCRKKCVIFIATFTNLEQTTTHSIESLSKVISISGTYELDNGRIRSVKGKITVALTEIDFYLYTLFYKWEGDPYIYDIYTADRGYLPPYILNVLNRHYVKKAEMKKAHWDKDGDPEHASAYAIEKSGVNSFFGMLITWLSENTIKFDGEWSEVKGTIDYERERKNQILLPQWGIYTTCWGRYQLLTTLKKIYDTCGNITEYGDTDSLKNRYHPLLQGVIDEVNADIHRLQKKRGITDPVFYDLGCFDNEPDYVKAKFNGAKRYLVQYADGSVHATIAGLPKDAILKYEGDPFEKFTNHGMEIEAALSGKIGYSYKDDSTSDIIDGVEMHEKSSIALFDMSFNMKIDKAYHELMMTYITEGEYE